jgi:iron only hydrogenase large subunit-like protein
MFSGAVKLGDLNDYIAPAQACVVALQGGKIAPGQDDAGARADDGGNGDDNSSGGIVLQRRRPPRASSKPSGFKQTYTEPPKDGGAASGEGAVRVTLHDCLACSGCVTSAETVLLQQQSADELLQRLAARRKWQQEQGVANGQGSDSPPPAIVVSISPQSRASLAALHGLSSAADAHRRLATFFKRVLGAQAVLDLGVAREVALLEAAEEFCARYAASGALARAAERLRAAGARRAAACADEALARYSAVDSTATPSGPLPVLASACPGWVCYAEKTHAEAALPHLSSARSPQGVMGALVKGGGGRYGGGMAAAAGWANGDGKVYHVTVMPCYDKKLEAARDELVVVGGGSGGNSGNGGNITTTTPEPEVDCCLATSEVQALLEAHGCGDLSKVEPADQLDTLDGRLLPASAFSLQLAASSSQASGALLVDQPPLHDPAWGAPGFLPGSGGWAAFVMRYASRRLFGMDVRAAGEFGGGGGAGAAAAVVSLPRPRRLRNADMHEVTLELRHALEAEGLVVDGMDEARPPPLLRFAAAYGFRNIQAVVRRLPPPATTTGATTAAAATALTAPSPAPPAAAHYYDFVEVMACPGGCLNGGGQMSAAKAVAAAGATAGAAAASSASAAAASLDALETYFAGARGPEVMSSSAAMDVDGLEEHQGAASKGWEPGASAAVQRVYGRLRLLAGGGEGEAAPAAVAPGSSAARAAFHTTYRQREKTLASAVGDW